MRWSQMFIPTLREEPANVEIASHKLLIRAGYIKPLIAGVYGLLPLAQRARLKIIEIIRQEMNNIGGQEFALSALQPLELWQESGRLTAAADILFQVQDRKGSKLVLGLSHEEVFTSIARGGLLSYKQLPQIWYQIQTKFRDEARPRGGLLRTREFTMKDSYSFDVDAEGLDKSFQLHRDAYMRIFSRCGLDCKTIEADNGVMGGTESVEFTALSAVGEDTVVLCSKCGYAANLEKAESANKLAALQIEKESLREFATPGVRTVKELVEFSDGAKAHNQIKTLVYVADDRLVLVLLQGDQELNEVKLKSTLAAKSLRQATEREIAEALQAAPGYLAACGVRTGDDCQVKQIVADYRLRGRANMITGANKNDVHLRGVSLERDIAVAMWADLHAVQDGEDCAKCDGKLQFTNGVEIGHIFKLGTRYSQSMGANVLGISGEKKPLFMACYGIGVERLLASIAEVWHDEQGLRWPLSVAPFAVVILPVNAQSHEQLAAAEQIYAELKNQGIDCLLDDRDERAGVKFKDADLIGVPYRITIGNKIKGGDVELTNRLDGSQLTLKATEVAGILQAELKDIKVRSV
jgi:prolyl-tRNA synthetase